MNKKSTIVIIAAEVIFLLAAVVVVWLFITSPVMTAGKGSDPEATSKYGASTDGDGLITETPPPEASDGIVIRADVTVNGAVVTVNETIKLPEPVTQFHGVLYALNYADVLFEGVGAAGLLGMSTLEAPSYFITTEKETDEIHVSYTLTLRESGHILSYRDTLILLTHFLMVPYVESGSEGIYLHPSFGDPFLYETYHYRITVRADDRYQIVAPGVVSTESAEGIRVTTFAADAMRDFPVVLSNGPTVDVIPYQGIDIVYIGGTKPQAYVENAIRFAVENIAPFPYDELIVAKTHITPLNGQEFSAMIFLAESAYNSEGLQSLVYHEVFHQWFYGLVGTDPFTQPFLEEGLVTMLSALLRNQEYTGSYQINRFANNELREYADRASYYAGVYDEAASYFFDIYRQKGERDFMKLLSAVCERYAYKIFSFYDWERMLLEDF